MSIITSRWKKSSILAVFVNRTDASSKYLKIICNIYLAALLYRRTQYRDHIGIYLCNEFISRLIKTGLIERNHSSPTGMKKIFLLLFILFGTGQLFLLAETYEFYDDRYHPKKGEYFPITHDEVKVRQRPDINSKQITQLNSGDMIRFIKRKSRNTIINGNEGRWAYIETGKSSDKGPAKSGWIFDYYVAYTNRFFLCTNCSLRNSSFTYNDITYHYKFIKSEDYILRIEFSGKAGDDFRRKCKEAFKIKNQNCYHKGKVYKYRNFMITQSLTSGRQYFIIKNNRLYLLNFPANRCR